MSEFKFEPKPPPEIPEGAGWDDTLRLALRKDGIDGSHTLQGYWENACEQAEDEGLSVSEHVNKVRESAVESLIDNLCDMPKEDAITTLVDLYAEKVL